MWAAMLLLGAAQAESPVSTWSFTEISADVALGTGVWGVQGDETAESGLSSTGTALVQVGPLAVAAGAPWLGQLDADIRAHLTFRAGSLQWFAGATAASWREGQVSVIPGAALGVQVDLSQWPVPGGDTEILFRAWMWGMGQGASFRAEGLLGNGPVKLWGTVGVVPYVGPERSYFAIGLAVKPWKVPMPAPEPRTPW